MLILNYKILIYHANPISCLNYTAMRVSLTNYIKSTVPRIDGIISNDRLQKSY